MGEQTPERPLFAATTSATRVFARYLRLPSRWVESIERIRVHSTDPADFRRTWTLEAMSLVAIFGCFLAAIVTWSTGAVPEAIGWTSFLPLEVGFYLALVRGHSRVVARVSVAIIGAAAVVRGYVDASAATYALMGGVTAVLIVALVERVKVTLLVSLGATASLVGMYLFGAPAAHATTTDIVIASTMTLQVGLVAVISSWSWEVMMGETNRAMLRNERLVATLEHRVAERTQELHELSVRDELTGLHNRRHFMRCLEGTTQLTSPVSILMIDVDHFKRINDEHGHAVGDIVLTRVAAALTSRLRDGDVLARLGGEEFAVLVTGPGPDHAAELAERLRSAVAAIVWDQLGAPVTVSVGVATTALRATAESLLDPLALLQAADHALYAAKDAGRNRVMVDALPSRLA